MDLTAVCNLLFHDLIYSNCETFHTRVALLGGGSERCRVRVRELARVHRLLKCYIINWQPDIHNVRVNHSAKIKKFARCRTCSSLFPLPSSLFRSWVCFRVSRSLNPVAIVFFCSLHRIEGDFKLLFSDIFQERLTTSQFFFSPSPHNSGKTSCVSRDESPAAAR